MNVFSRYLSVYPTANQDAEIVARVIINVITKHAYFPTTIINDKGSIFVFQVIREVADVLGTILAHARTKHAQTIDTLEKTHASSEKATNVEAGEPLSLSQRYVNIAELNFKTFYHTGIGCEPSQVFHKRVFCKVLDSQKGICSRKPTLPIS